MDTKVIATLTVGSADLCGRCEFRPEMDSTLCRLFKCSLRDPHGAPVRCKPCRHGSEVFSEAFPKWIPVSSGSLPGCQRLNGYWETVPVIIAHRCQEGGPLEVVGAFYEKVEPYDDSEEDSSYRFRTDEGLSYHGVEYWMPLPEPPQGV